MVKVLLPYFNKRLPFIPVLPKRHKDWVYNRPQNTAEGSRLHILSKNDPCSPPPGGFHQILKYHNFYTCNGSTFYLYFFNTLVC